MVTAMTEDGQTITLHRSLSSRDIQKLRKQTFYCPACQENLILRAGNIRIPHFAHQKNSNCLSYAAERESMQHLTGKMHLYEWFQKKGIKCQLEYYLPTIKQRPDLLVKIKNQYFAIEYQCAPISRGLLLSRTEGYRKIGLIPIWIVGGLPFQKRVKRYYYLSHLHWALARAKPRRGLTILSYCFKRRHFYLLTHITPITSRRNIASLQKVPIEKASMPLTFSVANSIDVYEDWLTEKKKWIQNKVYYSHPGKDRFLTHIYKKSLNPFLLPPIVGLPVKEMEYFASHAMEWQYYIFSDVFVHLQVGDHISLLFIEQKLKMRIKAGDILKRYFFNRTDREIAYPIRNYMYQLVELGYFKKGKRQLFKKTKEFELPKTMEAAIEQEREIYERLRQTYRSTIMQTWQYF